MRRRRIRCASRRPTSCARCSIASSTCRASGARTGAGDLDRGRARSPDRRNPGPGARAARDRGLLLGRRARRAQWPRGAACASIPVRARPSTACAIEAQGDLQAAIEAGDAQAHATLEALRRNWSLEPGEPFRASDVERREERAAGARCAPPATRRRRGAAPARRSTPPSSARSLLAIADSGPLFRVGELRIEGLQHHDERSVRNLADFSSGAIATEERLLDFQERLQTSGLFDGVSVEIDPDPATRGRDAGARARARGNAAAGDARRRRQRQHRTARVARAPAPARRSAGRRRRATRSSSAATAAPGMASCRRTRCPGCIATSSRDRPSGSRAPTRSAPPGARASAARRTRRASSGCTSSSSRARRSTTRWAARRAMRSPPTITARGATSTICCCRHAARRWPRKAAPATRAATSPKAARSAASPDA